MVKKEEKEDYSRTGYEDRQYSLPVVLHNRAVFRKETNDEITHFRLLVRLQQLTKRFDFQESCYKRSRVFNDFIIWVKSYMEVSSKTSDYNW